MSARRGRFFPALLGVFLVPACFGQQPAPESPDLETMRSWVEEVEARDYFFWRRYFDRLDRGGAQFPQPLRWYRPAEIIEGGEGPRWRRAPARERTISPSAWEEARQYAMMRKTGALLVSRHGVLEYEAYAQELHSASLVSGRSFVKSVVALLYGSAIERQYVTSLEDPIGIYLTEWGGDARGKISIRQLLTYSSGLELSDMQDFEPDSKSARLSEGSSVNSTALTYELEYLPDSAPRLNNADTQLAGLILERATGLRFAEIVSSWLWRPIEAGSATINLDGMNGDARTFCCMRARVVDWLRLGQLMLNEGDWRHKQVIPASYLKRMRDPSPVNGLMGIGVLLGWDSGNPTPPDRRSGAFLIVPQSKPFESRGLYYLLGGRSITMWIAPQHQMVVLRWGEDVDDWDNATVMNSLLQGIETPERAKTQLH